MLVAVKLEILSNEFVDDEILIGEVRPVGRSVVESAENLSSDFGPNL